MSVNWRERDEARKLYVEQDWSIRELENKYNRTMTDVWIPQWMREDRVEKERARKQRITNTKRKLAAEKRKRERAKKIKERSRILPKREGEKILAIADKHCVNKDYKTDGKSRMINRFLTRAW